MGALKRDFVFALRESRRRPLFAAAVIVTIAVAVGSATTVFGVVYGVLLRPLPIRAQERVVVLRREHPTGGDAVVPFAVPDLMDYAARTRALEAVAGVQYDGAWRGNVRDGERVFSVWMVAVSGEFFRVLGIRPTVGRQLTRQDDVVGAGMVAVISHSFWQREFGGDPTVVERVLRGGADGVAITVVGVLPPDFEFPLGAQMWIPTLTIAPQAATDRSIAPYNFLGRLREGATVEMARAELSAFLAQRVGAPGEPRNLRAGAATIESVIVGEVRPVLFVLSSVVTLLLLIAFVNTANLLIVRGVQRGREFAVRAAMGAGRARLIRQLMTESLTLAVAGGAAGLLIAWWLLSGLLAVAPGELPRIEGVRIDPVVVIVAAVLACVGAVAMGLWPALLATRSADLMKILRAGARAASGSRAASLSGQAVVVVQVAFALVVLISAGLLGRTLLRLQSVDLGYAAEELTVAELELPASVDKRALQQAFYDRLLARLQALPDVSSATLVLAPPYAGARGWDTFYTTEGQSAAEASSNPSPDLQAVLPGYFATLGIPIRRGRGIGAEDRDGGLQVVVVTDGLARRAWPGQDALGKRLKFGGPDSKSPWFEVVGIAGDMRYRDIATSRPVIFVPWAQRPHLPPLALIVARGRDGKPPALTEIRRLVSQEEREAVVANVSSVDRILSVVLARPRFNALVVGAFAAIALLIAVLGVYAVMSTFVRQRTAEIGVRIALGAHPRNVRRLILGRGLALVGAGMVCGLPIAWLGTRLLRGVLYEVSPVDPITIVASSLMMLAIGTLACDRAALAAGRVDPLVALKSE